MKAGMSEAAVRDVRPISKRSPLMAVTAVQALCNSTKQKLPAATIQERPVPDSKCEFSLGGKSITSFPGKTSCFKRLPMTICIEAY
jgi:hypothetical protein